MPQEPGHNLQPIGPSCYQLDLPDGAKGLVYRNPGPGTLWVADYWNGIAWVDGGYSRKQNRIRTLRQAEDWLKQEHATHHA